MPKHSKSNNNYKYVNILKNRCKDDELHFHVQRRFLEHLQCDLDDEKLGFWLASLQEVDGKRVASLFGSESASKPKPDHHFSSFSFQGWGAVSAEFV